jgi:hypothetical protein
MKTYTYQGTTDVGKNRDREREDRKGKRRIYKIGKEMKNERSGVRVAATHPVIRYWRGVIFFEI